MLPNGLGQGDVIGSSMCCDDIAGAWRCSSVPVMSQFDTLLSYGNNNHQEWFELIRINGTWSLIAEKETDEVAS
jgi:hypothetical protein